MVTVGDNPEIVKTVDAGKYHRERGERVHLINAELKEQWDAGRVNCYIDPTARAEAAPVCYSVQ